MVTSDLVQLTAITCSFFVILGGEVTGKSSAQGGAGVKQCTHENAVYDGEFEICYTIQTPKELEKGDNENQCIVLDTPNRPLHDAKIPSQDAFYRILEAVKRRRPDFAVGLTELLIGVTYRRGDGFRWMDGKAPNDLSFLKFNPIDNLDDDDDNKKDYCLRFTIKVDKSAQDGYATNWYNCHGEGTLKKSNRAYIVLCSDSEDREGDRPAPSPPPTTCRRNEIPVRINDVDLCYVHVVGSIETDQVMYADKDTCRAYSNEYFKEVGREREFGLSPAAVPTRSLLRLLQKEIVSVHRQFEKSNHGLLVGLMYIFHELQWKDDISTVHPSIHDMITGMSEDEEVDCYRFMLFRTNPDYLVPVPCSDKIITYDILCKYILAEAHNVSKIQFLREIKALIDMEPEEAVAGTGRIQNSTGLLIILLVALFAVDAFIFHGRYKF